MSVPGSAESPFRLNWLPQDAFAHAGWIEAERQALESIGRRERLLLLGLPGTGKTLLLRRLDRVLGGQGISVRQFRSGDPIDGLPIGEVLLIDEAGRLAAAECDQIIRLPNPLVMASLPNLPGRLSSVPHAFRRVTLEPLAPEDVARFVLARLAASGRPRELFTPEALAALARQSGGLLRLVIILAGAAMFFAEQRGAATVTDEDVVEAALMRTGLPEVAERDAAAEPAAVGEKIPVETVICEARGIEPAWLGRAIARKRLWDRSVAVAGVAGWVCASLAVVAIAAIAARGIRSVPSMAMQEVQGRSAPQLASAATPDLALSPASRLVFPAPVQTASALPPAQLVGNLPPPPEPTPSPEIMRSGIDVPPPPSAPPPLDSALPDAAEPSTSIVLAFAGPIQNDTMGQGGELSLKLRTSGAHGRVAAVFHASKGLIGSGVLNGAMGNDGRITLSGRLMMGKNPFDCALQATLTGERLVGAATFIRATSGAAAHSRFTLTRLATRG